MKTPPKHKAYTRVRNGNVQHVVVTKEYPRVCVNCGRRFTASQKTMRFCQIPCSRQWMRAIYKTTKTWVHKMEAIETLGGVCKDCGYKDDLRALQFDHILPKLHGNISTLFAGSWERIAEELERCELVCANCHYIRTHERKTWSHGKLKKVYYQEEGWEGATQEEEGQEEG